MLDNWMRIAGCGSKIPFLSGVRGCSAESGNTGKSFFVPFVCFVVKSLVGSDLTG